jgi:hypothetical protein
VTGFTRSTLTFNLRDSIVLGAVMAGGGLFTDDPIGALAAGVLWFIWRYLQHDGGVPVIAAALTFQWMQVTIGMWYFAATGRTLDTMVFSDYRPMVLIGLASRQRFAPSDEGSLPIGWSTLLASYVIATAMQGIVGQYAYLIPGLTQPILVLRFIRLGIVFLIVRRLTIPSIRVLPLIAVIGLEVVFGLTGYFAGFREPLVMVAVALYQAFDRRRVRDWVVAGLVVTLTALLATMWMSVRRDYRSSFEDENFAASREQQLGRISDLATTWWAQSRDPGETDRLVDRLWTVYYPALAVSRVPSVLPHTDGALMGAALTHVFNPRLFFPTKAELQSDSEMVRKYSGVYVAGAETGTSIAFGYAAESYIDYGIPVMFLPVLLYGLVVGLAYQFLATRLTHGELRAAVLTVVFWLMLYLFERSWVKTLGLAGTLVIYLGGPALVLDYYLSRREARRQRDRLPHLYATSELR